MRPRRRRGPGARDVSKRVRCAPSCLGFRDPPWTPTHPTLRLAAFRVAQFDAGPAWVQISEGGRAPPGIPIEVDQIVQTPDSPGPPCWPCCHVIG